jgi:hypothetical protein
MPEDQTGFGDPQQAGAYATYIYHARESLVLLTDPNSELRRLWVKTLKLFGGGLREICLSSPRDDDDRLCHIGGLDYLCKVDQGIPYHLGPHRHLDHDVAYDCRYPAAIAGDLLFSTAISCLAAFGVAITQITEKYNNRNIRLHDIARPGSLRLFSLGKDRVQSRNSGR